METYIDENGDLVTWDPTTGEIFSTQAAGTFSTSPTTGGGSTTSTGADPYASTISPGSDNPNNYVPPPKAGPTPGKSLHGVTPVIKGPGGGFYYHYADGSYSDLQAGTPDPTALQQAELAKIQAETNKIISGGQSAAAAATVRGQDINAATSAAQLAENKRQYDLTHAQSADEFSKTQALDQGKTLLGLGSRPDTLIKYLYALRGQQTPQAIGGTTTNLPGFTNVVGQPNPQPVTQGPPGTATTSSVTPPAPVGGQFTTGTGTPNGVENRAGGALLTGKDAIFGSAANPNPMPTPVYAGPAITELKAGATTPTTLNQYHEAGTASPNGIIGQGAVGQQFQGVQGRGIAFNDHADAPIMGAPGGLDQPRQVASIPNLPAGFTPGGYSGPGTGGVNPYANKGSGQNFYKGGVIPEEVVGVGLQSGQPYTFGEKGPEGVIPNDQMPPNLKSKKPDLFDQLMSKGGDIHYTEDDGKTKRSIKIGQTPSLPRQAPDTTISGNNYAAGGTIGYDPNTPSLGSQSAGLFNNPDLQGIVSRGYNSSPQTPLFPQIGVATNNGQSLVASSQRLNSLLPSEQQLYSGALNDEFGVQPDDVFAMAKKLAPQVSGLHTPKYSA